jgi:hypothetical protein
VAVLVTLSAVNGTFRPDAFTDSVPLLLAFASFVVVGALIVRHRPGNAVGWMFAAIALLVVLGALAEEYAIFAAALLPLTFAGDLLPDAAGNLLFAVVVSFLPVAAGVAILRYRLYEIDRLINAPWSTACSAPCWPRSTPPWSWSVGCGRAA